METTQENINKLLEVVKYVFKNHSEYEPILTGSLAMYLQGIDYGEINDIDIIFLKLMFDNEETIKNDIQSKSDIHVQVMVCPLDTSFQIVEKEIDDVNIRMTHHESVYKYLKRTFDMTKYKEKRLKQFQIYEEFLKTQEQQS